MLKFSKIIILSIFIIWRYCNLCVFFIRVSKLSTLEILNLSTTKIFPLSILDSITIPFACPEKEAFKSTLRDILNKYDIEDLYINEPPVDVIIGNFLVKKKI